VFAGIPLSAPVEKGFLPTAVLEETGIFGAVALLYVLWSLGKSAWRSPSLPLVAAFFTCLFVNFGEENLLSPSGIGFYLWTLIALAVRSGRWPEEGSSIEDGARPPWNSSPILKPKNLMY
jgi:hypothetical protein